MAIKSAPIEKKIIVLGESGCGKTCFVDMFIHNRHYSRYDPVTEHNSQQKLSVDGQTWVLEIMDVNNTVLRDRGPGPDPPHAFMKQFFQRADGFVLLYDVTSWESYDRITKDGYMRTILSRRSTTLSEPSISYPAGLQRFGCVLVGTKADLAGEKRQVNKDMAQEWADSQGFKFFEMDSFKQEPIVEAMTALAKSIMRAERRDAEDIAEEQEERLAANAKTEADATPSSSSLRASLRQAFKKLVT